MSVHLLYAQSDAGPAEYDYSSPANCVACDAPHDLDEDTGRNIVEGGPEGDFVLCDHCDLYCSGCGESLTEWGTEEWTKSTLFLKEGTVFEDGKAVCLDCKKEMEAQ